MPFTKGQVANPKGRPKGIPNKANQELKKFIENTLEFVNDKERFQTIMANVAEKQPQVFLNFIAKIAPKDLHIHQDNKAENPVLKQITEMKQAIIDQKKVIEVKDAKETEERNT